MSSERGLDLNLVVGKSCFRPKVCSQLSTLGVQPFTALLYNRLTQLSNRILYLVNVTHGTILAHHLGCAGRKLVLFVSGVLP
jgi:hypothetical protein